MSGASLGASIRRWLERLSGRATQGATNHSRERGQVLPIFVIMAVVILGGAALITDVAWWWTVEQKMQRAADAGALAGAVYLPGNESRAFSLAHAETAKNGYAHGQDGITVTPRRDPLNERKLIVDIDGDVETNFARVFSYSEFDVSVTGAAEFVLPVPMGSPENYYGIYGLLRTDGTSETADSDFVAATAAVSGNWTSPENAFVSETPTALYATRNSNNNPHQSYGFPSITFPAGSGWSVQGIEVETIAKSTDNNGCRLGVEISGNGGSDWTATGNYGNLTSSDDTNIEGGDRWDQASAYWTEARLSDANFRVRVRYWDPGGSCQDGSTTSLDLVQVRVTFARAVPDANVAGPQGQTLTPRGFWATMMTQGAETVNGDAFLPYYDRRTGVLNALHDAQEYYNYAVEMPANAHDGSVWLYDPGFCRGDLRLGLGDSWGSNNNRNPVTSIYTLYEDPSRTPYYFGDDVERSSSDDLFRQSSGWDGDLTTANDDPGPHGCDAYHLDWYKLADGLSGGSDGRTYRLHATTYDSTDESGQRRTNARNSFAIFVDAQGGTVSPRVYGIGAMAMLTHMPGGQSSEFYLAQIEEAHKGKTIEIRLWDAGDTNQNANLQILAPTAGGWSAVPLTYAAEDGSSANSGNCGHGSRTGNSIVTNQSGNLYNGCWLTITIPLAIDYAADQDGWWKIRYNMTGTGQATDITTWQVALLGNPVHLVQE